MPDLFTAIDRAWTNLASSPRATEVHQRWVTAEPTLSCAAKLVDLVPAAQGRDAADLDSRDSVQRALLRLARTDPEAQLAMLQVLRPGLSDLARRYAPFWHDDSEAMVVELTLERFKSTATSSARPAASIVHGVRNRLWRLRQFQAAEAQLSGGYAPVDSDVESPVAAVSAGDTVLRIVTKALQRGDISQRGARLILLHRLYDVPTGDLAALEGRDVRSVRKYRNRAESALSAVADVVA